MSEVWKTRVQVSLYVGVPFAFFHDQLAFQHNCVGQDNIDLPLSEFQEVLDQNERSCFTESFEEILYNADTLGIDSVVVYPIVEKRIRWKNLPTD